MLAKTGMNPGGGMVIMRVVQDDTQKPKPINTAEIPVFTYQPMRLADVLDGALPDIGLMAVVNLLFILVAVMAFARYDVR
jgi:hypothetical protein